MNDKEPSLQLDEKISALINTRDLALHCLRLENDLKQASQQSREQSHQIDELNRNQQSIHPYVELGKREMNNIKKEILSQMRAIVHFTGEQNRLDDLHELLNDDSLAAKDLIRWHKAITTEFQALYPTRALSHANTEDKDVQSKTDIHQYQLNQKLR